MDQINLSENLGEAKLGTFSVSIYLTHEGKTWNLGFRYPVGESVTPSFEKRLEMLMRSIKEQVYSLGLAEGPVITSTIPHERDRL